MCWERCSGSRCTGCLGEERQGWRSWGIYSILSVEGTLAQIHALLFALSKSSFTRCISSFSKQEASFCSNCCTICVNRKPQLIMDKSSGDQYCTAVIEAASTLYIYLLYILICFSAFFFPVFASWCVSGCSKANVRCKYVIHTTQYVETQYVLKWQTELKPTKLCHGKLLERNQQNIW